MDLRLHAVWLTALACGRPGDRVADVPTRSSSTGVDARAATVPAVDLGPGFEPIGFVPGRYAVLVQRNMAGVHARNQVTHRSAASLVLELGRDGDATLCRGWQHAQRVDGPGIEQDQRFRLQQGFRGSHVVRDGEVDVSLTADDRVCGEVRDGDAPPRAAAMTLRCVMARPRAHATLIEPVLLCEWRDVDSFAYYAFAADGVAPDRWLVLGGGNGVGARIRGKAISTEGAPVRLVIEPSATRIEPQAWDPPLPPDATVEP